MTEYIQINLIDIIENMGEPFAKEILSSFLCPQNIDIEDFLKKKAIVMAKQNTSPTHLVYAPYKGKYVLAGYYTITLKVLRVSKTALSSDLRKRISKFGTYSEDEKAYEIPSYLIAQLGKNYENGYDKLISGNALLQMACDRIREIQRLGGGKVTYLECEDREKLINFYERNGFKRFDKREIERSDKRLFKSDYFIRMLKYLG